MSEQTFVIVGASVAGARAAETLREEGFTGRVVLIGDEEELPYERPPLSKGVLLGDDEPGSATLHERAWYDEHSVELRLGAAVTGLDRDRHEVELADGDRVGYDKLLLATGSRVRRLDVAGADLDGVRYLRTRADALRLKELLERQPRVVVVGAGWIGLETAAAARHHGCEVTVVEPRPGPLHGVLGPEMSEVFAALHRDHGVDLRLGRGLAELRGEGQSVRAAVTDDATEIPADLVIVGVGVAPNTGLAEGAGLDVDNGVLVDSTLRTVDPDVFAAGDIARWHHPLFGGHVRVEHWANANDGGPAAARAMLGQEAVYDSVPFFFSDQYDLGMEYCGYVAPGASAEVVVRGDRDAREFVAFWVDGSDRVLAGMNVNVWDVQDDIQELIRSGRPVDRARLADPGSALAEVVAG